MNIRLLREQIISQTEEAFEKAFSKKPESASRRMELVFPPNVKLGDFAVEFFAQAKALGISPAEVAKKVEENFEKSELIDEVKSAGPYLNIKVKNEKLFGAVIGETEKEKENFGNAKTEKGKKVMIEYLSPNTNKPLHLGHARNGAIGMALSHILESQGYDVIKAILVNDRGVHICKSMLAWLKWGNGETPESAGMKGDHFVGKYYVKYNQEEEKNPELEKEVEKMLEKWEANDEEIIKTWKLMNGWVYGGFEETYRGYGFRFDEMLYESDTYKLGKDIIKKGLADRVFRKDETGSVVFDLPESEFGRDKDGELKKQTVLRAGGTGVYMTQDIGTAAERFKKYNLDKLIYVVGSEQIFHFKALFYILKSLGYDWAKDLYHFFYGMISLPEGKMKSREGKVVDADDLMLEVKEIVSKQIEEHDPQISAEEKDLRAEKIALGAIKFQMLRVRPAQDIRFDPKESVAIDGFTGPYCQYAYARICGILRQSKEASLGNMKNIDYFLLENNEERLLAQKIIQFPDEVKKAAEELNPLRIVNSVYETAKAFNQFYNLHPVLNPKNEKLSAARLKLVQEVAEVLKKGLNLIGIEVLERM